MAIEFHCEHCGKAIKAPTETAGQRGKCPACHLSVYIPTPSEDLEPLNLAPIDREDERERLRAIQEARDLTRKLLGERDIPGEGGGRAAAAGRETPATSTAPSRGAMERMVIGYAVSMANGDLAAAETVARDIRRDMRAAEDVMQQLTINEIPHEALASIPRPVLVGFFKQLREKK